MEQLSGAKTRIVILGGGFGGAFAAQTLAKNAGPDVEVVLIDRNNFLLFYPLLIEAGVGTLEPRHVVVPLRKFMPGAAFVMAEIHGVDTEQRQVHYQVVGSDEPASTHYDHLVFALGSVTKIPPVPGLKEYGFEMKSLTDAIEQRDRGIRLLELANTLNDPEQRKALLTFVVVGANYTGVELAGEYDAFIKTAAKDYKNVRPDEIKVILLEYADKILGGMRQDLAKWVQDELTKRGVDIRTKTSVKEVGPDYAILTTGERIATHTVNWTAGIAPPAILKQIPAFPVNERGYLKCTRELRVEGFDDVWAVGDVATVKTKEGSVYAQTAQVASRQGPHVARNILAVLRGEKPREFDFTPLGAFAPLGHHTAAADVKGRSVKGFLGWFIYRSAYLVRMPTFAMKLRLVMDWTVELFFHSDPVQLGVHRTAARPPFAPEKKGGEPAKASLR